MNSPTLDDIMRRERMAIKRKRMLEEERESQMTIKTRTGKTIPVPKINSKPMESGITVENGIPVNPEMDFELRRRRKRHGSGSEEI